MSKPPDAPAFEEPESASNSFQEEDRASAAAGGSLETTRFDWSDLLPDLLVLVLKHLPLTDRYRFPAVCKSWLSVAEKNPPPQLICMAAPEETRRGDFYSPFEDRIYTLDLPEDVWYCLGCHDEWIFIVTMENLRRLFMFNPISGARIQLPDLQARFLPSSKVIVSSAPCDPDCVVVACYRSHLLSVYKPGAGWDRWASVEVRISDVIFHKGSLIMTDTLGAIKRVEIPTSQLEPPNLFHLLGRIPQSRPRDDIMNLVEFNGGLLVVFGVDGFPRDSKFHVFKPHFRRQVWEDVQSLGDWIILLSSVCHRVVKASELPDFEPDSIYVAYMNFMNVFHVSKRTFQPFCSLRSVSGFERRHPFPSPHVWLSPRAFA